MQLFKKAVGSLIIISILLVPVFFSVEARAATTSLLRVGSTGTQVSEIQRNLKTLGYYNYSSITGYYGSITKYAVIRFQQANNLYVDGIAGPATINRINEVLKSAYTVQSGDSLWTISLKYGTTVDKLKILNGLSTDYIYPGQIIKVSGAVLTTASLNRSQSEDLYWLSRIIEAESSGEPYQGKVAVGNVVINRKVSTDFPNTIKGVIFEYYKGIPQFSPVADGRIYNNPSQDSIRAAQDALSGAKPVGQATYFFNPEKSPAVWIVNNKTYLMRIGDHVFYK